MSANAVQAHPQPQQAVVVVALGASDHSDLEDCGCYCRPPVDGSSRGHNKYEAAFRLGSFQVTVESFLCFFSFLCIGIVPSIGFWIFISFVLTLMGASIAICCCPTQHGWNTCYNLTLAGVGIRCTMFIVCIIVWIATDVYALKVSMAIYVVLMLLSFPLGFPFLRTSKSVSGALRIMPFDPSSPGAAGGVTGIPLGADAGAPVEYPQATATSVIPIHSPPQQREVIHIQPAHVSSRMDQPFASGTGIELSQGHSQGFNGSSPDGIQQGNVKGGSFGSLVAQDKMFNPNISVAPVSSVVSGSSSSSATTAYTAIPASSAQPASSTAVYYNRPPVEL